MAGRELYSISNAVGGYVLFGMGYEWLKMSESGEMFVKIVKGTKVVFCFLGTAVYRFLS